ncbi:Oidioi.mRNA.OKI2018_I69.chr1.g3398.t1.cds [Oikopleura dioica]|uniref:Oidioi.mRNA.OKI2018_I69.chr1.g3398.t1.cds n=1 Tax=Oikopleura dioica TaxID=34765 RepID=A0ABN7SU09_OIKDI|nr:Oidioi.mRNA.OKI2018_I69.chr1.g3398.t1.cds [Oikopleura dioica]
MKAFVIFLVIQNVLARATGKDERNFGGNLDYDPNSCNLPENRQMCVILSRMMRPRSENMNEAPPKRSVMTPEADISSADIQALLDRLALEFSPSMSDNPGLRPPELLERSVRTPETDIIGSLRLQALRERLARERAMMRNFGGADFDF